MIERAWRFIEKFRKHRAYTTPTTLKDCVISNPKEQKISWQDWSKTFLSFYQNSSEEDRTLAITSILGWSTLDLVHLVEAACEEFPENKDLAEIVVSDIALYLKQKEDLDELSKDFIFFVRISEKIPNELKKQFPKLDNGRSDVFQIASRNATSTIILERLASDQSPKDSKEILLINLKKVREGNAQLPEDPEFTEKLLEVYGDNRKIKKALKKIHKRFGEWSKTQTSKPQVEPKDHQS